MGKPRFEDVKAAFVLGFQPYDERACWIFEQRLFDGEVYTFEVHRHRTDDLLQLLGAYGFDCSSVSNSDYWTAVTIMKDKFA